MVTPKPSLENVFVLDGTSSKDVAATLIRGGRQKEPFFILDLDEAYRRILHFKKMMPRVQIFYAVKSNDHDKILKLMVAAGVSFDCASPGEIYKVLQLNVNPLSIIFSVPTKMTQWMTYARDAGVKHTTFDSSCELNNMKRYWPDAKLLIKLKLDGDSVHKLSAKFGCDFKTEALGLLEEAAELGLEVVGVAFHVGSGCFSAKSYEVGLRWAKSLFDHEKQAGRGMYIVDIGGGFLGDRTNEIDLVSTKINAIIKELFPDPSVQVIAEPGRYLSESSCTLYCSINCVRQVMRNNEQVNMVYLNDGPSGTLKHCEAWNTVEVFGRQSEIKKENLEKTILWGPTCDADRAMHNVDLYLPRCSSSDWLVFPIRGAYSFTFATFFSCLQVPQIRPVISKELWNKIKAHKVFKPKDFIEDPDVSVPLPSTMPGSPLKNLFNFNSTIKLKTKL